MIVAEAIIQLKYVGCASNIFVLRKHHVETSGFGQCGGDWGLRPSGVALGRRLGIGSTGELVGSWHKELGFH